MWTEFYYDETSPTYLRWAIERWSGFNDSRRIVSVGDVAGGLGNRCWRVTLDNVQTSVHRIIFEMKVRKLEPGEIIDHIDGNPFNNKVANLRAVTPTINNRNKRKSQNNTSGVTGVYRETVKGHHYWMATYKDVSGKRLKTCRSVAKFGEDEAKRLATAWRESALLAAGYTERHGT